MCYPCLDKVCVEDLRHQVVLILTDNICDHVVPILTPNLSDHVIPILTDTMCDPCLDKVCVGDLSDHVVPVVGVVAGPVDGSHLIKEGEEADILKFFFLRRFKLLRFLNSLFNKNITKNCKIHKMQTFIILTH